MAAGFKIKLNGTTVVTVLSIIILFITSWAPYMTTSAYYGTDAQRNILKYLVWSCIALSLLLSFKRKTLNQIEFVTLVAVLIYRIFYTFYAYDFQGFGLTSIAVGFIFCFQTDEIRADVFRYFKYIMVVTSVLGIICFISYFASLGIPYTVFQIPNSQVINFKVCYFIYNNSHMLRFNGFFNEPGWFGTWVAFYLCADDLNLKKIENIILIIAGTLTFSLAFVMLLVIYYILKNLNDWRRWLWLIILILLYLFALPNIKTGNNSIDHVLQRMVITKEGLVGDNRYGSTFARLYESTIHSNKVFWGYGAGYAEDYVVNSAEGLASIKSYIVNFGIIGTAIIYLPTLFVTLWYSYQSRNRIMLFYILITFASLYQRPYLFWNPYFIMFICGLSYTKVFCENEYCGKCFDR